MDMGSAIYKYATSIKWEDYVFMREFTQLSVFCELVSAGKTGRNENLIDKMMESRVKKWSYTENEPWHFATLHQGADVRALTRLM
jgi:hypothetical protein